MTALASSPRVAEEIDAFGRKALKLSALFGLDKSARVLLAGAGEPDWNADLRSLFADLTHARTASELDAALGPTQTYDLIVWTPGIIGKQISHWMKKLRSSLSVHGTALILAENRFSARSMKRHPTRIFSPERSNLAAYSRRLVRSGFEKVHCFLPLPAFAGPEEFISLDRGEIALPAYATLLESTLNKSGLLWTIHDGAAYIASGPLGGEHSLLSEIEQFLPATENDRSSPLTLERFDLRDRGALLVFLRSGANRMVCRIAVEPNIDRVVKRNDEWIRRIHDSQRISPEVKSGVPRSLGSFEVRGGNAYLETLTPGVISWKLSGSPQLEPRLFTQVADFITKLGSDTVVERELDSEELDRLLASFTQELIDPHVADEYHTLCDHLRRRITGETRKVGWTHGDFGYGNVIVDGESAELQGVIDWDQAREGLAGVDLVNFLVQRERALRGRSLPEALKEVGYSVGFGGFRAFDSRLMFDQKVFLSNEERRELIAWATLRFAQRGMAYPALFAAAREETRVSLAWASKLLEPSQPGPRRTPAGNPVPVRVLFLHRGHNLIRGSEEALLTFLEHLDQELFRPLVLCSTALFRDAVAKLGIEARVADFPELLLDYQDTTFPVIRYDRARRHLADLCRREKIGMIFSSGGGPCQLGVPVARNAGIPLVCLFHHPAPWHYHLQWRTSDIDTVIFTSQFTAEHTREMTGKTGTVVYVGIDSEKFAPAERRDWTLRRSLGITDDEIVFAQVGSLVPSKGHEILLDAFQKAQQRLPSARLLIIGSGEHWDHVAARVQSAGLSGSVIMTGFVADVVPYFQHVIDVNVLASVEEGMGLVNLQSSSCGLPNIGSDCTGIREAVLHGRTGFLFETANSTLLAEYMIELAIDRGLRERMGAAGRQFILNEFSPAVYVLRVQELMSRTLAPRA